MLRSEEGRRNGFCLRGRINNLGNVGDASNMVTTDKPVLEMNMSQ